MDIDAGNAAFVPTFDGVVVQRTRHTATRRVQRVDADRVVRVRPTTVSSDVALR
ncbi:MAG: hypothetical protein Q8O67_34105 [Deltaproteobacteria bacterium]|nr:hypothetical protein [Deltaproteobacteria bacterium]